MQIAIASGKGGTGKTTVATNLAHVAAQNNRSVAYLDCDVEEPNGHIFLKPQITERRPVGRNIPNVDAQLCTLCGQCGQICQYSAIVCVGQQVLVHPDLCHSCGGCVLVCQAGAITEVSHEIGHIETGQAGSLRFVHGLLDVGQAMSPPLIREVKRSAPQVELILIDAPPGTSCPVIESIKDADYVLLATEPTPFGLNDLKLAVEMVRALRKPFGVIINRSDIGDGQVRHYCTSNRIAILAEIPHDRQLAEAYAQGIVASQRFEPHRRLFTDLLTRIEQKTTHNTGWQPAVRGGTQ